MPNKNKTACKRRIRSQRSQRRRYRTARNGGWSPFQILREESETRRRSNVPAKVWQSPRRWNAERKTRNLANQIATQRAAAEAVVKTYNNTQAQLSAHNANFKESDELNKRIRITTKLLERTLTQDQRDFYTQRLKDLQKALRALNSNTTAVYNAVPAEAKTAKADELFL